jgi:hypothetical protein
MYAGKDIRHFLRKRKTPKKSPGRAFGLGVIRTRASQDIFRRGVRRVCYGYGTIALRMSLHGPFFAAPFSQRRAK